MALNDLEAEVTRHKETVALAAKHEARRRAILIRLLCRLHHFKFCPKT